MHALTTPPFAAAPARALVGELEHVVSRSRARAAAIVAGTDRLAEAIAR